MIEPADHDKGHHGALFAGPPPQWAGRERFVWLMTDFGDGARFLAAWGAWRADPDRCERLHVIAIDDASGEPSLGTPQDASLLDHPMTPLAAPADDLPAQLASAMPARTPDLHRLAFENGRVQLSLAFGDVGDRLPSLLARVDRFDIDARHVDGARPRLFKALARLARVQAVMVVRSAHRRGAEANDAADRADTAQGTASTDPADSVAPANSADPLGSTLRSAGFMLDPASRSSAIRDIVARYDPPFTPRQAPPRLAAPEPHEPRHALIVGAGLAGCAAAWALAEQGWTSTIVDRHPEPAQETSGQHAGLFHGIVTPQDGAHARFNRAAAIALQRLVETSVRGVRASADSRDLAGDVAVSRDSLDGIVHVAGLLRLASAAAEDDDRDEADDRTVQAMRRTIVRLGLPDAYVQALDAGAASALGGLALDRPAWFYPGGGWARPAALARWFATQARASFVTANIVSIRRDDDGWMVVDAAGDTVARAATLVWAAGGTQPPFGRSASMHAGATSGHAPPWPVARVRGQTTLVAVDTPGLRVPRLPIAGLGYALPSIDGLLMCGATVHDGDEMPRLREADQRRNLEQLQQLTGSTLNIDGIALAGRVGWRAVTADRLPIIGGWPDLEALARVKRRPDQSQLVPRLAGLYVITSFGSRGITWSVLAAQTLASLVTGAPCPLPADLLDAVDAGRFAAREGRR